MTEKSKSQGISSFSGLFWLVIFFEFIERGSYYGVMSYISIYLVRDLHFAKESVGLIKGVIQPLLYFLPIVSGAIADRFGYRKLLMVAFSFMGLGYFLTSQTELYGPIFIALVIMGIGAGLFKPLISGTIAKLTNRENSTLGFGIYYWSINIGAFLFPTILVYILKEINPVYPIIAAAICTASMLIPTALFFKDPVQKEKAIKRDRTTLIQTLANAFEIIYSPIVLLYYKMSQSKRFRVIFLFLFIVLLGWSLHNYSEKHQSTGHFSKFGLKQGEFTLIINVDRNMLGKHAYSVEVDSLDPSRIFMTLFKQKRRFRPCNCR